MTPFSMVKEFHEKFGLAVDEEVTEELLDLRSSLICEETYEVYDEMDARADKVDRAKLTKELCDAIYVHIGTAVTFGLPLEEAFAEVHRSNMSKLGDDGKPILREDGKALKGPNYTPANIEQFFN